MNIKTALKISALTANLSKDPTTKVGATLFSNNQVVSIGYNGKPRGFNDFAEILRDKEEAIKRFEEGGSFTYFKYDIFEHAERNLMYNFLKYNLNTNGLICLTSQLPSMEDVRALISAGIKHIAILKTAQGFKYKNKFYNPYMFSRDNVKDYEVYAILNTLFIADVNLFFIDKTKDEIKENFFGRDILINNKMLSCLYPKFQQFFFNFEELFLDYEADSIKDICFIIKDDFSVLDIQLEDDLSELKEIGFDISCIRKSLYNILSRYINESHTLLVTMAPCINCLYAIALAGIKKIVVSNNSMNENTNHSKWLAELQTKAYKNIVEKFNISITQDL